jgi:hypothetical protein
LALHIHCGNDQQRENNNPPDQPPPFSATPAAPNILRL